MAAEKILVVEDDFYFLELIESVLKLRGLQYDLFVRAQQTKDGLSFMDPNGKLVVVDLSDYLVGLVDSRIKGSVMQGKELTQALTAQGLSVIAVSGVEYLNNEMVAVGAIVGIRKDELWTGLFRGTLDLPQLVRAPKN
jgi:hypothetical protein